MTTKNSRVGKRELVVFLTVEANTAGYDLALASGWSRQSLLARAINAFMAHHDLTARLDHSSKRVFAVPCRKRSVRETRSRVGKMGIAGWYLESALRSVQSQLFSKGFNCQVAGEQGIALLLSSYATAQEHITQENAPAPTPEEPTTQARGQEEDTPAQEETHASDNPAWVSTLHDTSEMPDF